MTAKISAYLILAAAITMVSGCSTTSPLKCPAASALVDTSALTMLRTDSTPLYMVQIDKVTSDCTVYKYEHSVETSLDINFTATRRSAGSAASYSVPYFVAVTQGAHVVSKRRFNVQFSFDAGETTVNFADSVDSTKIQVAKDKKAYDYALMVGIQLTKDQLDYNRTVGRYPK
jgi:hypothetical protein